MLNIYKQKNNDHSSDVTPPPGSTQKNRADAGRFEDVTGEFSTAQFKRSVWLVTHKVLIYKLIVIILAIISIGLWLFSGQRWADYLINGIQSDINLHRDLTVFPNYLGIHERYAPKPVQTVSVSAYNGGSKTYDLVAEVSNPNKNFIIYFDYYFISNNQKTASQKGMLLTGESRPLTFFGLKDEFPGGLSLVMENVVWKRINAHTVLNPIAWQADRLNFSVNNFSFSEPQDVGGVMTNMVKFNITNNSAFGYREAVFVVGLLQNGSLVGVMPLNLQNLKSLETREIDLRNFSQNLTVTEIQLFPSIDIYSKEAYLAPER